LSEAKECCPTGTHDNGHMHSEEHGIAHGDAHGCCHAHEQGNSPGSQSEHSHSQEHDRMRAVADAAKGAAENDDVPLTACSCSACHMADAADSAAEDEAADKKRRREHALLAVSGVFVVLGIVAHLVFEGSAITLPLPFMLDAQILAQLSSLVGTLAGLAIIAPKVLATVRARRIDINVLMAVAVVGAWLLGDFAEAGAVVFLFCVGELIEGLAVRRSRESISSLVRLTPQTVPVIRDGRVEDVAPEQVAVGEHVVIRPGSRVPLDGVVVEGSASLDTSAITGESVPVFVVPNAAVLAGSLGVDGRLVLRTTATVEDSTLARIVRLVRESQAKRTPYERAIDRFARYYTPLVIVVAALVALVPTALGALMQLPFAGFEVWGYRALSVLVIGCPCALVIATPVSVVSGLTRAARIGVLVKGGAFLELASRVKAVAFDKTGTLTYGQPEVLSVALLPGADGLLARDRHFEAQGTAGDALANNAPGGENDGGLDGVLGVPAQTSLRVLALAAALERESTHPLARAIVSAYEARAGSSLAQPLVVSELVEQAGRGIVGMVDGKRVAVGSQDFAEAHVALGHDAVKAVEQVQSMAASALFVMYEGTAVAVIAVRDRLRAEAPEVVRRLTEKGFHTAMLSGDNARAAASIAREAGVGSTDAGLLPHEKTERLGALREGYGTVAMVGDGINDAPALARADVGIAMGAAGSDTALEVADVALMANSLESLPSFFSLSRMVVQTIHVNIAFAFLFKAVVIALAATGVASMWLAISADVGVLLLVLLYSMSILVRPLR
jgi:Cd2+/Zn2+-exporting ATPase